MALVLSTPAYDNGAVPDNSFGSATLTPPAENSALLLFWGGHKGSTFAEMLDSASFGGLPMTAVANDYAGSTRAVVYELLDISGRADDTFYWNTAQYTEGILLAVWLTPSGSVVRVDQGTGGSSPVALDPAGGPGGSYVAFGGSIDDGAQGPSSPTPGDLGGWSRVHNGDRSIVWTYEDISEAIDIGYQSNVNANAGALYGDSAGAGKKGCLPALVGL